MSAGAGAGGGVQGCEGGGGINNLTYIKTFCRVTLLQLLLFLGVVVVVVLVGCCCCCCCCCCCLSCMYSGRSFTDTQNKTKPKTLSYCAIDSILCTNRQFSFCMYISCPVEKASLKEYNCNIIVHNIQSSILQHDCVVHHTEGSFQE